MNGHSYAARAWTAGPPSLAEEAAEDRLSLRRVAPRGGIDAERGQNPGTPSPAPASGKQEEVGGAPGHRVNETERLGEDPRRGGQGEHLGEAVRQPESGETPLRGEVPGRGAEEVGHRARHFVPGDLLLGVRIPAPLPDGAVRRIRDDEVEGPGGRPGDPLPEIPED